MDLDEMLANAEQAFVAAQHRAAEAHDNRRAAREAADLADDMVNECGARLSEIQQARLTRCRQGEDAA